MELLVQTLQMLKFNYLTLLLANGDRRVFQVYSNSSTEITSYGFGIGYLKKKFIKKL